jgi:hypothetical protein
MSSCLSRRCGSKQLYHLKVYTGTVKTVELLLVSYACYGVGPELEVDNGGAPADVRRLEHFSK